MASPVQLPQPVNLTTNQTAALQPYLRKFKEESKSAKAKKDAEERRQKVEFFQLEFPKRIPQLSEADLTELVETLWATQIWGNKQYLVQQIVAANGLDNLRANLQQLWNTTVPVASRYNSFIENVSHLGPAALTEMMCLIDPSKCGIWNHQAREALKTLGLTEFVSPSKYRITGAEYEVFNQLLAAIAIEIQRGGLAQTDLLMVDYFLYEVAQVQGATPRTEAAVASNHDEVCETVEAIGTMLGFKAEREVTIAAGARVDVVWRAWIGNLGMVSYVFEVQSGGSIDSLILNLQRAKNNATVQKVIAVSDDVQLAKIERETESLSGEFKKGLAFWPISDVLQASDHLRAAMGIIGKLGLAPSKL